MTLMHPSLVDELHDTLLASGIARPDVQIDNAIQTVLEDWRARIGATVELHSITRNDPSFYEFMHERHGVFDLLEIDVEEDHRLYDRAA